MRFSNRMEGYVLYNLWKLKELNNIIKQNKINNSETTNTDINKNINTNKK
jgi:hypothetical protein